MAKQQQLSPEKYITTKARSLPIAKCYLTAGWEHSQMATVMVMRQHVNGNFTTGIYLVDLLCLGIKDTFYFFNISPKELDEKFDINALSLDEVEYNLVHNIIYAGHDFAMDFDIKPHKDFSITKYILEEDDDNIPLIEIPVGDEEGKPHLMVDPSYNYAPALRKLEQNAGEGNYTFDLVTEDDMEDLDDGGDDENEFYNEDDDFLDDEKYLDFYNAAEMSTNELSDKRRNCSKSDALFIDTELLLRQLNELEPGSIESPELIVEKMEFKLFDRKKEQWKKAEEVNIEAFNLLTPEVASLALKVAEGNAEDVMPAFLKLLDEHKSNDMLAYMIADTIPLPIALLNLDELRQNFSQYPPAVQLLVVGYDSLWDREDNDMLNFILNAANVEMAYPFNRFIHSLHHQIFWLIKAMLAIKQNDKPQILYYHNLIRISGTSKNLNFLYAAQLKSWLTKYLGLEEDEDETDID